MAPWNKKPRWTKGTYMRLISKENFREFLITQDDIEAHKKGQPMPHKMTQRGLADRIGVHPSFINHLTSGRRTTCEPATAERIAEVLNVPLKLIFLPTAPSKKRQIPLSQMARAA
ncbi:helix-turn-helix transcriptional regulator [Arthrobacter sp. AQ5-05]|uniref:helix-turn-helix transcriptional regulator n=1 Tax=Arthrobacter sp. AQ5-05 TaxID=2184581 RepID=UPI001C6552BE|nr:helix-turn-helix transcriptional regulator [Arthrobacter sp. AQ5-05]